MPLTYFLGRAYFLASLASLTTIAHAVDPIPIPSRTILTNSATYFRDRSPGPSLLGLPPLILSCARESSSGNFALAFCATSGSNRYMMSGQRHCPFCKAPSSGRCSHLALAVEARDLVRRCVEFSHGESQWRTVCEQRRVRLQRSGEWSPECEDFTWLETAFCDEFLKGLRWFGGMEYEWRTGPKPEQGGFWVLLWSKEPQHLWWELLDKFERQRDNVAIGQHGQPPLFWPGAPDNARL